MIPGTCHNFAINVGYSGTEYPEYYGIWIDLNHDEDFSDPGEKIFQSSAPQVGGTGVNIDIPTTGTIGETRMRVVMSYSSTLMPCGSFAYGEVEDYTVNILASDPICSSSGNSTTFEYIESVTINSTEEVSGNNGGYTRNFCAPFYLNMGRDNAIELNPGYNGSSEYPEGWTIWIDYDKNDIFENDELVYKNYSSSGTQTFDLRVPNSLNPFEIYRMRISMQYSQYQLDPCANFSYGEVEDYVFVALDPLGVAEFSHETSSMREQSIKEEITESPLLSISPNPASEYIEINLQNARELSTSYRILNRNGIFMNESEENVSIFNLRINVSNYPGGYYIFQMLVRDRWESIPFVVIH